MTPSPRGSTTTLRTDEIRRRHLLRKFERQMAQERRCVYCGSRQIVSTQPKPQCRDCRQSQWKARES